MSMMDNLMNINISQMQGEIKEVKQEDDGSEFANLGNVKENTNE